MADSNRIPRRRQVLANPSRYGACLAVTGPVLAVAIWFASARAPWNDGFTPSLEAGAIPVLTFVAWIVGGLFRRYIARARGAYRLLLTAMLANAAGIFACLICLWTFTSHDEHGERETIAMKVIWFLTSPLFATLWTLPVGWSYLPVSFPLAWLAVIVLRAASGGTRDARAARVRA